MWCRAQFGATLVLNTGFAYALSILLCSLFLAVACCTVAFTLRLFLARRQLTDLAKRIKIKKALLVLSWLASWSLWPLLFVSLVPFWGPFGVLFCVYCPPISKTPFGWPLGPGVLLGQSYCRTEPKVANQSHPEATVQPPIGVAARVGEHKAGLPFCLRVCMF